MPVQRSDGGVFTLHGRVQVKLFAIYYCVVVLE